MATKSQMLSVLFSESGFDEYRPLLKKCALKRDLIAFYEAFKEIQAQQLLDNLSVIKQILTSDLDLSKGVDTRIYGLDTERDEQIRKLYASFLLLELVKRLNNKRLNVLRFRLTLQVKRINWDLGGVI